LVTPRIRRIVETALDCDDLAVTASFYTTLLGTTPMVSGDRLVALDAGEGTVLLLFQRSLAKDPVQTPGGLVPAHDAGGPGHLAFAIDAADIAGWEARLAELGVGIESRVTWERGGFSLYFRDPDNRSVELASPGVWPSY
jgi:catechol 2,3-dioxygenase-like lactoylglutathione lyase family enzyme